jgi:pimeloyl-ACP methyl ester carboxylesterase
LHLAAIDDRVRAVVAVAPFDAMRDEVPHYWRTFTLGLGHAISDSTFDAAVDRAGEMGGFWPDASVVSGAIRQSRAHVLVLHGEEDWLVPPGNGAAIHLAAAPREFGDSELVLLPKLGHVTIWFDPGGDVARRSVEWFDRQLQGRVAP